MTEPYLAPSLKDQGYTGATGTTPYKPASQQQLGELQAAYNSRGQRGQRHLTF